MPNVFDYLEWRGDLTFEETPVNDVDNLIFCLLSYVDLDGIVPTDPAKGHVPLRHAAAEYFFTHGDDRPLGLIVPTDILTLFRRMAHTRRFRDLELTGYTNAVCEKREMQFSALTVRLPAEQMFVAFRGTDDTLVGWREDFNLSHMEEIPSQRMAAAYLNALDVTPDTALYVGGHSKGGNLAVWGSLHADADIQRRILGGAGRCIFASGQSVPQGRPKRYRGARAYRRHDQGGAKELYPPHVHPPGGHGSQNPHRPPQGRSQDPDHDDKGIPRPHRGGARDRLLPVG